MSQINNDYNPTEAKGGIKYELVLEKPSCETPPKTSRPLQSPARQFSVEDIVNKLKVAEERRKSLEAQKLGQWQEKERHIEMLRDKRNSLEVSLQETTREQLEKKMEAFKENRDSYIRAIQDKQREHVIRVETKRKLSLGSPVMKDKLESIQKKIASAKESREQQIAALQERLREHDKHVAEVRKQMEGKNLDELKEKLESKLKTAEEKRETILKEIQERLSEHDRRVAEVR